MDFPSSPNHTLPTRLIDRATASRYTNGLVRIVEDGDLHFAVGQRRVLDAIFGGDIRTAVSQIWLAAEARRDHRSTAIHPLHLLNWVVQRADVIEAMRYTPAFSLVWNLPATGLADGWRWMLSIDSCQIPLTEVEYSKFQRVVRQLEKYRNVPRSLLVDKFRHPVTV